MEIPSGEEVANAHRESEELAADAARHQWLDGLEEEGRKQGRIMEISIVRPKQCCSSQGA